MKLILFALILLSIPLSSFADRIPIAVLNLDAEGVDPSVAGVLTETVRYEFGKQKDFDLVAREKMIEIAKEKAFQLSGCTDISCAVAIGKALNVQKMVVGTVGKLGPKHMVFLRVVDVEKENVVCNDKEEGEVSVDEIPLLVPPLVQRLSACLLGKPILSDTSASKVLPRLTLLRVNEQGYKEYRDSKDGSVMAYIPEGEFLMGSNDGARDEWPAHKVNLDGYYIDKYEVSNAQYRKFCDDTKRPYPQTFWRNYSIKGNSDYPVTNIKWEDAFAYTAWAGKRLPTEAEWEKAARGTDGRRYPWGDAWEEDRCSNGGNYDYLEKPYPVGSFTKGASPYGIMDMAGNVWEWCNDWYGRNYYQKSSAQNPQGPASGKTHVMRGGSRLDSKDYCRTTCRGRDFDRDWKVLIGFRCVR